MTESIAVVHWLVKDHQVHPLEAEILRRWNLKEDANKTPGRKKKVHVKIQDFWKPPQVGFIKLNFDGASKGNLGSNRRRWYLQKPPWRTHSLLCFPPRIYDEQCNRVGWPQERPGNSHGKRLLRHLR
jgi:hypothetical protein